MLTYLVVIALAELFYFESPDPLEQVLIIVTGFAKRGLRHTSNIPTLTIDNFRLQ